MARDRTGRPRRRRAWRWLTLLLVLAVGVGLGVRYADELRALRPPWSRPVEPSASPSPSPDPVTAPALVLPPPEVSLPSLVAPAPVARPLPGVSRSATLDPTAVRLAVAPGLLDRKLGSHVVAAVAGLDAGDPVFDSQNGSFIPASTTKVVTAAAALQTLGPDHVFATRVVAGTGPGQRGRIILVGGGDPHLTRAPRGADGAVPPYPHRADLTTLARRAAAVLRERGRTRVRVAYDDGLFTGPSVNPTWKPSYITDADVAPITALAVDGGRPASGYGRVADPSADAASAFVQALRGAGIRVLGPVDPGPAPAKSRELARVTSAPLAQIVERVLDVSDNEGAEALAHHVGLATRGSASFAAGAEGSLAALRRVGVPLDGVRLFDGSGLSRKNRLTAAALLGVLRAAASDDHPQLRPVVTGLPVAGFTGSLTYRFAEGEPAGRGRVRAKTGTLKGVHGLAGVATDLDGRQMAFVLVADRVRPRFELDARYGIDRIAGELGACRCGRPESGEPASP